MATSQENAPTRRSKKSRRQARKSPSPGNIDADPEKDVSGKVVAETEKNAEDDSEKVGEEPLKVGNELIKSSLIR